MAKTPSPCIGVCKFKRTGPAGAHCIGCSMTKVQKKMAKRASKSGNAEGEAFVALVAAQQEQMGRYTHWRPAYLKRCLKKGVPVPEAVRKAG
ncbi:DUF1289 domain-containing protein [Jannaschia formosa]|uniref:DUF1289 domain-containing protein n=1 Tax=Jannaschia formosa TaxID=2259592 RepID=UPI000E1C1C29|nr:DUF1289 domain-containing protein [Jannaschia formosa]TFL18654.1 DUF1289 domain-containing protein [Jannaschia formosa]